MLNVRWRVLFIIFEWNNVQFNKWDMNESSWVDEFFLERKFQDLPDCRSTKKHLFMIGQKFPKIPRRISARSNCRADKISNFVVLKWALNYGPNNYLIKQFLRKTAKKYISKIVRAEVMIRWWLDSWWEQILDDEGK